MGLAVNSLPIFHVIFTLFKFERDIGRLFTARAPNTIIKCNYSMTL